MKTITTKSRNLIYSYVVLLCLLSISCTVFALEPIATIGNPFPEKHSYASNNTIIRVQSTNIQLVDTNTGEVIDEFGTLNNRSNVFFSPNATHLVILNPIGDPTRTEVEIWDISSQQQISKWQADDYVRIASFSPTEQMMALSYDDEICLYNWQSGKMIGTMNGNRRTPENCLYIEGVRTSCKYPTRVNAMNFTPDGRNLIVASLRPDIEIWDVETQQLVGHLEGHTGNWVDGLVISPDGKHIATYERDTAQIYVWDLNAKRLLWNAKNGNGRISGVVFSPDNQYLYVASNTRSLRRTGTDPYMGWDDIVRIWDVNSGRLVDTIETEFRRLQKITLSPNGNTILLEYMDAVVLWDINQKKIMNVWKDYVNVEIFTEYRLSPDGKKVVSVSPNSIKSWDVEKQEMLYHITGDGYQFDGLAISPDSKQFVVHKSPWVEIRDIQTGKVETQFIEYIRRPEKMTYSSTGKWIAAGDYFKGLTLFDVENPEKIQRIQINTDGESHTINAIGFSDNDKYLAVSISVRISNNNNQFWIHLWKRDLDTYVYQYKWEAGFVQSPAFTTSTDGSTLLVAHQKENIHIWKLTDDKPELLNTIEANYPVKFTPDGRYLISDGIIWDRQTNMPIYHPSIPYFSDINKDGTVLLSYKTKGQYQVWDITHQLSLLPNTIYPDDKILVQLGEVKRNQLLQNFPNPSNPETWIPFQIANKSDVRIHIYTQTGKLVRTLSLGVLAAGEYTSQIKAARWDGRNSKGEPVSSGIYYYKINAGEFTATRKMIIRK